MKIAIRVNKKRLKKFCSPEDIIGLYDDKLKAVRNVLAKFIIDPRTNDFYLVRIQETKDSYDIVPDPEALKIVSDLTLDQLAELVAEFKKKSKENTKWLM